MENQYLIDKNRYDEDVKNGIIPEKTIIEKQVWESILNRSMVLEAENTKLKELLKECELWFTGVVGNMNDKSVGEHNRNLPIGNFEYAFKVFSQKINHVLGEDK